MTAPERLLSTICATVAVGECPRYPMPTASPAPVITATVAAASHQVERSVRSLTHSKRAASANPYLMSWLRSG